jgi:hypothetical protein
MRQWFAVVVMLVVAMAVSGCGRDENLLRAKGQVLRDGEKLIPEDEEYLQVAFVPINDDKTPARNWYIAEVNQNNGSFVASGGQKKGMPPGKYRVVVELLKEKKDLLKGKFNGQDSPFVFDVYDTAELMMIDVEDPPEHTE